MTSSNTVHFVTSSDNHFILLFAFGGLKQVDPRFLADAENLFIVQFKADTKHLNRYKALRFD